MIALTELEVGATSVVLEVLCAPERRRRLAAYGLVAGTPVLMLQHRPTLVIAIDGTELALEACIGQEIRVRRG